VGNNFLLLFSIFKTIAQGHNLHPAL